METVSKDSEVNLRRTNSEWLYVENSLMSQANSEYLRALIWEILEDKLLLLLYCFFKIILIAHKNLHYSYDKINHFLAVYFFGL